MAIEKILKMTAAFGVAMGIAFSSVYGNDVFKSKEKCEASIEKVDAEITGYMEASGKDRVALVAEVDKTQYLMEFNRSSIPFYALLKGFPVNTNVKISLQACSHVGENDFRKRELFKQFWKVMYAEKFSLYELKLAD